MGRVNSSPPTTRDAVTPHQHTVDSASPAARVGLPDRWSVTTRRLAGAAAVLTVVVSVPLADIELGVTAWIALVRVLVVLAFSHVRAVDRQVNRLGNVLGTGLVTLLVVGTGALLLPTGFENATMLAAFGGLHLIFGPWIARRHGG